MLVVVEVTLYVDESINAEVRTWELLTFTDGQERRSMFVRYRFKDRHIESHTA